MHCRILVTDDHDIVRRGVILLLHAHPDWLVCGEAKDGREAVEKARQLCPDVVIMDIGMPNLNGVDAARQILKENPKIKILFLTLDNSEHTLRAVLETGARGLVLKSDAAADLRHAVEMVCEGKTYFSPRMSAVAFRSSFRDGTMASSASRDGHSPLTPREREIFQLIAEGKSNKEIAVALFLSVKTVETHRTNAMRKLDIHSQVEAVMFAVRNGIIQVTDRSFLDVT